jgi:hypothetical protein
MRFLFLASKQIFFPVLFVILYEFHGWIFMSPLYLKSFYDGKKCSLQILRIPFPFSQSLCLSTAESTLCILISQGSQFFNIYLQWLSLNPLFGCSLESLHVFVAWFSMKHRETRIFLYFDLFCVSLLVLIQHTSTKEIPNVVNNNNSVALVPERTIATEQPPLVGEVSANFCG